MAATAFSFLWKSGNRGISDEERALLLERRDMGTGGQGAYPGSTDGFFVPVGFANRVEVAMKYYGPMLDVAQIMPTATGGPLPYPTANDTSVVGELISEGSTVNRRRCHAEPDHAGRVQVQHETCALFHLNCYRIPPSTSRDSWWSRFAVRLGRILNQQFTNGTGTAEHHPGSYQLGADRDRRR